MCSPFTRFSLTIKHDPTLLVFIQVKYLLTFWYANQWCFNLKQLNTLPLAKSICMLYGSVSLPFKKVGTKKPSYRKMKAVKISTTIVINLTTGMIIKCTKVYRKRTGNSEEQRQNEVKIINLKIKVLNQIRCRESLS